MRDDPFAHQSGGGVRHVTRVHGGGKVRAGASECPELSAALIVTAGTPPQAVGDVGPSPNLVWRHGVHRIDVPAPIKAPGGPFR